MLRLVADIVLSFLAHLLVGYICYKVGHQHGFTRALLEVARARKHGISYEVVHYQGMESVRPVCLHKQHPDECAVCRH